VQAGEPPVDATPPGAGRRLGVSVGKFNPPHLGHLLLLTAAAARCDELHVLVGRRPGQALDAADRAAWLADALPDHVRFHVTDEDIPEAPGPWAAHALELLPRRPDVAFTSEAYGAPWAAAMGCAHEPVDPSRSRVPTSGTALRADLRGGFALLVPAARAALARRVVLVGAESTGKSTLADALAAALRTTAAPEHGRTYWGAVATWPTGRGAATSCATSPRRSTSSSRRWRAAPSAASCCRTPTRSPPPCGTAATWAATTRSSRR
jgi:NadR type nicotinamide-nucleotide adenylyltransferase